MYLNKTNKPPCDSSNVPKLYLFGGHDSTSTSPFEQRGHVLTDSLDSSSHVSGHYYLNHLAGFIVDHCWRCFKKNISHIGSMTMYIMYCIFTTPLTMHTQILSGSHGSYGAAISWFEWPVSLLRKITALVLLMPGCCRFTFHVFTGSTRRWVAWDMFFFSRNGAMFFWAHELWNFLKQKPGGWWSIWS